jgi:hypothetical protein
LPARGLCGKFAGLMGKQYRQYGSLDSVRIKEKALIEQGYTRAASLFELGPKQYSLEPHREIEQPAGFVLVWETDD